MAEWKKIVVSGSAISQLANDSGYLSGSQTIASASVAERATTLSADATASFADRATSASIADSISQLATASFADSATSASNALYASTASVADRATELSADATASFADSASFARMALEGSGSFSGSFEGDGSGLTGLAGTLTVDGDTGTQDVDLITDDLQILGTTNEIETAVTKVGTDVKVTLGLPANITVTASFADRATSASIADEISQLATASFADSATSASNALYASSASVADRADELSPDATASFADRATSASIADEISQLATASFADSATTASHTDGTASFADLASTVHDGNITAAKIATDAVTTDKILNGNVTNAKLANDSVTIGTTEIDLGTTAASLEGLTSISATTGSFVLQIFESSSTIITSGSNIFGDAQNDIQQFTGSILQTGSMTSTGTITADEFSSDKFSGSFSGSFQGDGSQLSGIATTLTVDGDTGTEDVDLVTDDLQILGTTDEIEVAVTKVGTDVKATIGLPANITVTASFATNAESASEASHASTASVADRATELSADATASFADRATSASIADEISQLATASFADRATSASIADELSQLATASFADSATTASQADRATSASIADELSQLATASFADSATSASIADTATSASATVAGILFPTTDGIAGQAIVTDGAGTFTYGDIFGTGSTAKLNQSSANVTWSFQHNLDEVYPIVQVYDDNGDQLIPERINSVDANNVEILFAEASTGVAAAMVGGMGISASFAVTASHVIQATSASIADSLSGLATASFADSASFARLALEGSGSFSGSFEGDGSNLTGIATQLTIDADSGGTSTVDLQTQTFDIAGTAGEIETSLSGQTVTIGLPTSTTIDTLTVSNNATIAGNLTVGGAIVSASSLEVADQFIILASGSNGAIDGGIIVNQVNDDPDGRGVAFAYDSSADRWALQSELVDTATTITPDAYVGVIQESAGVPSSDPVYGGTSGKGTIFVDTSNNEAYIYI
jgi:hypothetical protein